MQEASARQEEVIYYGAFTIARVKEDIALENGKSVTIQGVGISKQSPDDKRDKEMGVRIAKGRAIKAINLKLKGKKIRHPYMR